MNENPNPIVILTVIFLISNCFTLNSKRLSCSFVLNLDYFHFFSLGRVATMVKTQELSNGYANSWLSYRWGIYSLNCLSKSRHTYAPYIIKHVYEILPSPSSIWKKMLFKVKVGWKVVPTRPINVPQFFVVFLKRENYKMLLLGLWKQVYEICWCR